MKPTKEMVEWLLLEKAIVEDLIRQFPPGHPAALKKLAVIDSILTALDRKWPSVDKAWIERRVNEAVSLGMTREHAEYFVNAMRRESGLEISDERAD